MQTNDVHLYTPAPQSHNTLCLSALLWKGGDWGAGPRSNGVPAYARAKAAVVAGQWLRDWWW